MQESEGEEEKDLVPNSMESLLTSLGLDECIPILQKEKVKEREREREEEEGRGKRERKGGREMKREGKRGKGREREI